MRDRSSRTLDQRFGVRFPRIATVTAHLIARLPPSSRIRQAALRRIVVLAMEAYNRRDLDAVAVGLHPDLEYHPCYIEATEDVWGADVRLEPTELIDLGDRLVLIADMPMRAQASGIALAQTYASVWTLKGGRVIRVDDYLNHSEALEAVGLS